MNFMQPPINMTADVWNRLIQQASTIGIISIGSYIALIILNIMVFLAIKKKATEWQDKTFYAWLLFICLVAVTLFYIIMNIDSTLTAFTNKPYWVFQRLYLDK